MLGSVRGVLPACLWPTRLTETETQTHPLLAGWREQLLCFLLLELLDPKVWLHSH